MIDNLDNLIFQSANNNGIDATVYKALVYSEMSSKNPAGYVSPTGAIGPAQVSPGAAADVGISANDLYDPATNIEAGARYLAKKLDSSGGDYVQALQSYKGIKDPSTPENQKIIKNFMGWYSRFGGSELAKDSTLGQSISKTDINQITKNPALGEQQAAPPSTWADLIERAKHPQFIGIVILILLLSVAAFSELSIKGALEGAGVIGGH